MDFQWLNNFLIYPIELLPHFIITLLVAFTIHELAHAYVAYKFGDPTAKNQGRLTLNPMAHLDPLGTILLLIAGFGWARPVPVNRFHFKNPRLAGVLVSVAGPLSNLMLAAIGVFLQYTMYALQISGMMGVTLEQFFLIFTQINIILFIFNLLPLPPLDGYRIIQDIVSPDLRAKLSQYEVYGTIIFLVLLIVPQLRELTIGPLLSNGVNSVFFTLHDIIGSLFGY